MHKTDVIKSLMLDGWIKICFYLSKVSFVTVFNSLPDGKILVWSKLKALADDKLTVAEKLKFVLGRVENIVGKGVNAGYHLFLLFPKCFQKASFSKSLKVGIFFFSNNVFLPFPKQILIFLATYSLSSASALNLDWSKILSFSK